MIDLPSLLVVLKKVNDSGLRPRDFLVLAAVRERPNMMGRELAQQIGFHDRSAVQDPINRLMYRGFLIDKRRDRQRHIPNQLFITPEGEEILNSLLPPPLDL